MTRRAIRTKPANCTRYILITLGGCRTQQLSHLLTCHQLYRRFKRPRHASLRAAHQARALLADRNEAAILLPPPGEDDGIQSMREHLRNRKPHLSSKRKGG